MSDFKAEMHQIVCRLGLRLRQLWGLSLWCSPDPLADFWAYLGGEGREGEG